MEPKQGKLYRVKAIHPEKFHGPVRHTYFLAEIQKSEESKQKSVKWLLTKSGFTMGEIVLEVGDVFMSLGNFTTSNGGVLSQVYSVILFGGRVYKSNLPVEETYVYYELEQVGDAL